MTAESAAESERLKKGQRQFMTGLALVMFGMIFGGGLAMVFYFLNQRTGATTVVVTHDLDLAFGIADRIAFLLEGEIVALGTPDEIRAHPHPLLQRFLKAEFR